MNLYGKAPESFPEWLVQWAEELERLLPLFRVEVISEKIRALNIWLLYLAGLPKPPKSFAEVVRAVHINSPASPNRRCFNQFLRDHYDFSKAGYHQSAVSVLRQAWQLAATQHGFSTSLANPIDLGDSPGQYRGRVARTVRSALDSRVAEIIARENMRDDMRFARKLGEKGKNCWREVRLPNAGERRIVFFPAAPVLIHIILHTGMRGMQARWLDSGEGDEDVVDLDHGIYVPNSAALSQKGRREGFLRLCETMAPTRTRVLGMWINSGKAGPHEVPWIHEDVVGPVRLLRQFQEDYYPISGSVPIESSVDFNPEIKKRKGYAFPLARDPANRLGYPLSPGRLRSYWTALLKHCQALVDAELGYHYSLIGPDGVPRYDVHSLRVTLITTLLENGVPVSVVQMLVGHKSPIMTWYYQDVSNYKIHSALQQALERRKASLKNPSTMSGEEEFSLVSEVVTLRTEEEFAGAEMLKLHRETGSAIDVFAHGICPGGSCEIGGERFLEQRYKPVWRPRACSGCRFRVTGPAFLNGLVQRANGLIWETKASMRRESDLNEQIEIEEDAGRPIEHLRTTLRQEHVLRDHLFNEWCLELRTIRRAEEMMGAAAAEGESSPRNMLMTSFDLTQIGTHFREVHEFELAQRLVHDAEIIQSRMDLPVDVLLYRDQVLQRIAHSNGIGEYFYTLDSRLARRAMDAFGETLVSNVESADQLQSFIDGSLLLREVPGLNEALTAVLSTPSAGALPIDEAIA